MDIYHLQMVEAFVVKLMESAIFLKLINNHFN